MEGSSRCFFRRGATGPRIATAAQKAEMKQKTADCKKQAKEQKLGWLKSRRFVRQCVKK